MLAAHLDFGEDVLVSGDCALFVDVDHGSRDVKERDHLRDVCGDGEGVGFTRWLENIVALIGGPVVFEVLPFAFDDVAVDGGRVAVAAEDSRFADSQKVDPVALSCGEAEWAKPDVFGLGNPDSFIDREHTVDHDVFGHLGWIEHLSLRYQVSAVDGEDGSSDERGGGGGEEECGAGDVFWLAPATHGSAEADGFALGGFLAKG